MLFQTQLKTSISILTQFNPVDNIDDITKASLMFENILVL